MSRYPLVRTVAPLLFMAASAHAQSGGSYTVTWSSIDTGGSTAPIAGGQYTLRATIGQPDASLTTFSGGAYGCRTGFWASVGTCAPDVDGNGLIEPVDIAQFVNAWFTSLQLGTLGGDFDGNGFVQPADVAAFVSAWFSAISTGAC